MSVQGSPGIGAADGVAATLNFLAAVTTSAINAYNVDKTNASNEDIAKKAREQQMDIFNRQFDYAANLQNEMFRREDTSYQRTAADLVAAGYSPLAMNGTNDSGSAVAMPSAPQFAPAFQQAFQAVAPQFDFHGIADSYIAQKRLELEEQRLELDKKKADDDYQFKYDELTAKREMQAEQLDTEIQVVTKQIEAAATNLDKQLAAQVEQFAQTLQLQSDQLKELMLTHDREEQRAIVQHYMETVREATDGLGVRYEVCKTPEERDRKLLEFYKKLGGFIKKNHSKLVQSSWSGSLGIGNSGSTGEASSKKGLMNSLTSSFGLSGSGSASHSKDARAYYRELLREFYGNNAFPVLEYQLRSRD